jgi:hypothetical protein
MLIPLLALLYLLVVYVLLTIAQKKIKFPTNSAQNN